MTFLGCLGWLIVGAGGLFTLASLANMTDPTSEVAPVVFLGLAMFSALVGFLGFRLARSQLPPAPPLSRPEQRILAFAQKSKGRVTLAEVVLACNLPADQARQHLTQMVRDGMAELHLSDGGDEVYAFAGFMPETKKTARDPLE